MPAPAIVGVEEETPMKSKTSVRLITSASQAAEVLLVAERMKVGEIGSDFDSHRGLLEE
jgi:hypothetical protein